MNLATFLVAITSYIFGKDFVNSYMLLLMLESAAALIIGGVYGSIISSASFHGLDRFLRREETKRAAIEGKMATVQEDKNERERTKREIRRGKRFVILGGFLLLESILIALSLML